MTDYVTIRYVCGHEIAQREGEVIEPDCPECGADLYS